MTHRLFADPPAKADVGDLPLTAEDSVSQDLAQAATPGNMDQPPDSPDETDGQGSPRRPATPRWCDLKDGDKVYRPLQVLDPQALKAAAAAAAAAAEEAEEKEAAATEVATKATAGGATPSVPTPPYSCEHVLARQGAKLLVPVPVRGVRQGLRRRVFKIECTGKGGTYPREVIKLGEWIQVFAKELKLCSCALRLKFWQNQPHYAEDMRNFEPWYKVRIDAPTAACLDAALRILHHHHLSSTLTQVTLTELPASTVPPTVLHCPTGTVQMALFKFHFGAEWHSIACCLKFLVDHGCHTPVQVREGEMPSNLDKLAVWWPSYFLTVFGSEDEAAEVATILQRMHFMRESLRCEVMERPVL